MAGLIDELKQTYNQGSSLIRIIFINLGVFIVFRIVYLILYLSGNLDLFSSYNLFAVPSYLPALLFKPWTIVTYMFYHEDIWHIVFNLLTLFWFGKIFLHFFDEKKLTALYFMGGIVGAAVYILAYNFFPVFSDAVQGASLIGASAAAMAIIFAVSLYAPDFKISVLFLGEVKLIYIALVSVLLDLILISSGNPGGHISHLGGAFVGWIWSVQYRKGKDFTTGISQFFAFVAGIFKRKSRLKVSHKKPLTDLDFNRSKAQYQNEVDRILDKISKGGYESLNKEEKELLFKMSDKKN